MGHSTRPNLPRQAFTIVELLVVVVLIGVLVAMILPALGRARQRARATVCVANLRTFSIACAAYRAQNNDFIPIAFARADVSADRLAPFGALASYLSAPLPRFENGKVTTGSPFRCPSDGTIASVRGFSYALGAIDDLSVHLDRPDEFAYRFLRVFYQQNPGDALFAEVAPFHSPSVPSVLYILLDGTTPLGKGRN